MTGPYHIQKYPIERHEGVDLSARLLRERDALVKALENIAAQKTTFENLTEDGEDFSGCYEEGYDAIIKVAREALNHHVGGAL